MSYVLFGALALCVIHNDRQPETIYVLKGAFQCQIRMSPFQPYILSLYAYICILI